MRSQQNNQQFRNEGADFVQSCNEFCPAGGGVVFSFFFTFFLENLRNVIIIFTAKNTILESKINMVGCEIIETKLPL